METETLLAIGAGATFLLAIAAFWVIWQNYSFRKAEKEFTLKTIALDNIHKWLMEVISKSRQYLIAVRGGDATQKYMAVSDCNDVLVNAGNISVYAGIFGMDFVEKISQVEKCASAYHDALGLDKDKPDTLDIVKAAMSNNTGALSSALTEVSLKRVDLLSEFILKKGKLTIGEKFQKLLTRCRSFFLRKHVSPVKEEEKPGKEPENTDKGD